jgi:hypothetical protein
MTQADQLHELAYRAFLRAANRVRLDAACEGFLPLGGRASDPRKARAVAEQAATLFVQAHGDE